MSTGRCCGLTVIKMVSGLLGAVTCVIPAAVAGGGAGAVVGGQAEAGVDGILYGAIFGAVFGAMAGLVIGAKVGAANPEDFIGKCCPGFFARYAQQALPSDVEQPQADAGIVAGDGDQVREEQRSPDTYQVPPYTYQPGL
ncbi:MAG: hypothetical protein K0S08_922 [Gammaproteobacteria bacterium]|jgi:predicted lipid-binding transport protein (Tim44 family)|nr:hypothetical protein [Gammaproteobacteria bacterium]